VTLRSVGGPGQTVPRPTDMDLTTRRLRSAPDRHEQLGSAIRRLHDAEGGDRAGADDAIARAVAALRENLARVDELPLDGCDWPTVRADAKRGHARGVDSPPAASREPSPPLPAGNPHLALRRRDSDGPAGLHT
jgi:hypothetical protein